MEDIPGNSALTEFKMVLNLRCMVLGVLLSISSLSLHAAPHLSRFSSVAMDHQIEATLDSLSHGNFLEARVLARQLSRQFPKFALGHLLSAELEATAAFQDVRASNLVPMNRQLIDLLLEAQSRLQASRNRRYDQNASKTLSALPSSIIQMGNDLQSLLVVDLKNSTINHIVGSDDAPTSIRQHYIGSGKAGFGKEVEGDNKTPLGVYTITGKRHDATLPDLYGSGALTLNYPNALDRYLGRTGYGIWIHGVPHAQSSRAPRSSEGCVTMSNDHLASLMHQIEPQNSLVVLTNEVSYITKDERSVLQRKYRKLFTNYQMALTSDTGLPIAKLYDTTGNKILPKHTEKYKRYIAGVNPDSISIILNPALSAQNSGENAPYIVMRGRYGPNNQYPLAIYWKQLYSGEWRIATELRQGPNSS